MTGNKAPLVHAALILANTVFGVGSIVGDLGLEEAHPLAFTFERQVVAGVVFLLLSFLVGSSNPQIKGPVVALENYYLLIPKSNHWLKFAQLGFFMFANQAGYICGLFLAGPVAGSIWQPSAPIFAAALSMLMGLEKTNTLRVTGVLLAFLGCTIMNLMSDRDGETHYYEDSDDDAAEGSWISLFLMGNGLFFLNCLSTAWYILYAKDLLSLYPSLTVAAWSYLFAAPCMFLAAILSSALPAAEAVLCPSCSESDGSIFRMPTSAFPVLLYYVLAMSVGSWGCILWANQYASGTLVIGYSVLQPVVSLSFSALLVVCGWVASCKTSHHHHHRPCLYEPGIETFAGILGVFLGLFLVIRTEPTRPGSPPLPTIVQEAIVVKQTVSPKPSRHSYGSIPRIPTILEEPAEITP